MSFKSRLRKREFQVSRQSILCTGCCRKERPVTDPLPSSPDDHVADERKDEREETDISGWCQQVCQVVWLMADERLVDQQTQLVFDF